MYEGIARQPEAIDLFSKAADEFLGEPTDYKTLPNNVKATFIQSLFSLFDSISRQPVVSDKIIEAAKKYSGYEKPTTVLSEEEQIAKMSVLGSMYEGIARQPEAIDSFLKAADEFLGEPTDYKTLSNNVKATFISSLSSLFDSIARQPEASDTMTEAAKKYSGYEKSVTTLSEEEQMAKMSVLGSMYESIARQPEAIDLFSKAADEFLGQSTDYNELPNKSKASFVRSLFSLFQSISRQPEKKDLLIETMEKYSGYKKFTFPLSEEEEIAKLEVVTNSLNYAYSTDSKDTILDLLDSYFGEIESIDNISEHLGHYRNYSIFYIFSIINSEPSEIDSIIDDFSKYIPSSKKVKSYILPNKIIADEDEINIYFGEKLNLEKSKIDKSNFIISNNTVESVKIYDNYVALKLKNHIKNGEEVNISYQKGVNNIYSSNYTKYMPNLYNIPAENITMQYNSDLLNIKLNNSLIDGFDKNILEYNIEVSPDIDSVNIIPVAENENSTIKIVVGDETPIEVVPSGSISNNYEIDKNNTTTIQIHVISQDTTNEKIYTINIKKSTIAKEKLSENLAKTGSTMDTNILILFGSIFMILGGFIFIVGRRKSHSSL
ncbi:MAG: cadherin-like beta sandwich domain-containing protein, partial [Clostridiaceae bacterium]